MRHKWIGRGGYSYAWDCKVCGIMKTKKGTLSAFYYDKNGNLLGTKAPECKPMVKPQTKGGEG